MNRFLTLAVRVLVLAVAMAAATWLAGWWTVAVVAAGYGLLARRQRGVGGTAALAAVLAWAALLALSAAGPRFEAVLAALGGLAPVPALGFVAVTLLGAAALGWSAATLGAAVRWRRHAGEGAVTDGPPVAAPARPGVVAGS